MLVRVDDFNHQSKVTAARRIIYEKHYQVNSAAVERMLEKESLVPAMVRNITVSLGI
jgi:hypothetical protein